MDLYNNDVNMFLAFWIYFLLDWICRSWNSDHKKNTIDLTHCKWIPGALHSNQSPNPHTGTVRYERNELRYLHAKSKHDNRLKIMPFGKIQNIRKLGLNKRPVPK